VERINPDIIYLHGAENAYYLSAIFQFLSSFPVILSVQGFISKTDCKKRRIIKKRIIVEEKIIRSIEHAFYRTETMAEDIRKLNPGIKLYWSPDPQNYFFTI